MNLRILIVEDSPDNAQLLSASLSASPYSKSRYGDFEVTCVETLAAAIDAARDGEFDLVLLDLGLPDSRGLETLRRMRAAARHLPIVVLTGLEDDDLGIESIECGAQDYLFKGHVLGHLLFRVVRHSFARHRQMMQFENEARTDSLTRLPNRRAFDYELGRQFASLQRYGGQFSLVLADIDHFKRLNDERGHIAGDQALCRVADALAKSLRQIDLVARYGGEEFAAVLPNTSLAGAVQVANRMRRDVAALSPEFDGWEISVSLGAAEVRTEDDRDTLVARADAALYAAKAAGRNRVYAAGGTAAQPQPGDYFADEMAVPAGHRPPFAQRKRR